MGTDGGIQAAEGASWVCFCEMKWYSDISGKVTHDIHRNQLARVIENAIAFGSAPLDQGQSLTAVAQVLGVSRSTLQRVLPKRVSNSGSATPLQPSAS